MEATDGERREVAEKLRKTQGIKAFVESLGIDLNGDWYWTDVSGRVADLINPTCHDLGGEEGTNFEGYDFGCSECGYVCDLPQPNYCPNCGARVVGE